MHPVKSPPVSRGRDRHVIAVPVLPDSVALEVAVVQQVFGRRPFPGADDLTSRYQVVLCGERRRQPLPCGVDLGDLAPLETVLTADTVLVPSVENPFAPRSRTLLTTAAGRLPRRRAHGRAVRRRIPARPRGRARRPPGHHALAVLAAFREEFPSDPPGDRPGRSSTTARCTPAAAHCPLRTSPCTCCPWTSATAYAEAVGRLLVVAPTPFRRTALPRPRASSCRIFSAGCGNTCTSRSR